MPDIALLPEIATALDTTSDVLLNIKEDTAESGMFLQTQRLLNYKTRIRMELMGVIIALFLPLYYFISPKYLGYFVIAIIFTWLAFNIYNRKDNINGLNSQKNLWNLVSMQFICVVSQILINLVVFYTNKWFYKKEFYVVNSRYISTESPDLFNVFEGKYIIITILVCLWPICVYIADMREQLIEKIKFAWVLQLWVIISNVVLSGIFFVQYIYIYNKKFVIHKQKQIPLIFAKINFLSAMAIIALGVLLTIFCCKKGKIQSIFLVSLFGIGAFFAAQKIIVFPLGDSRAYILTILDMFPMILYRTLSLYVPNLYLIIYQKSKSKTIAE